MVKQVVWSRSAQKNRREILEYWKNRNRSNAYSIKLNNLFKQAVELIAEHPLIGKPTDIENVRVKIIRDYLLIYEIAGNRIQIHTIWDSRQDPKKRP